MTDLLRWGGDALSVDLSWSAESAPRLAGARATGVELSMPEGLPLVEILAVGFGHRLASDRLVHSLIGAESRYLRHELTESATGSTLALTSLDPGSHLETVVTLSQPNGVAAIRFQVVVRNAGAEPIHLRSVATLTSYLGVDGTPSPGWTLHHGRSDWLAEGRWTDTKVPGPLFPALSEALTHHNPRGEFSVVSTGTWSTGKHLPVAVASSAAAGVAWAWQLEHNGAWRWEVGHDTVDDYMSLSGPTHVDHNWLQTLEPGEEFESIPVTLALGTDLESAIAGLTAYRRASRRAHPDNERMSVIFNDYMNTLDGDPTTDRLLPLVDAAAAVGAEIFCIDAGWYDDSGDWWDSVGAWQPSLTRFPNGLGEVIDRIRSYGMTPGLWLEPEVVGVQSPIASELPDEAFLRVGGVRTVEQHRYHLDLRHPATIAHLDSVIDRLVEQFGIGYFKLDYNVNPGTGTDAGVQSSGSALLEHNRAHLAWLDGVLDRHPGLVLENCASGAMRSDWALLSRLQLQSTSDQQDFLRYPPIVAAAPMMMLPEQAANWAYPQPGMSSEEAAFCLVTGLAGRFFLSGYLNRMNPDELALVAEAVSVAKQLSSDIRRATPFWPLGLPRWDDPWVALGLATDDSHYLAVWSRDIGNPQTELDLRGRGIRPGESARTVFPRSLPGWQTEWNEESGTLRVTNPTGSVGARVFRITATDLASTTSSNTIP